MHDRLTRKSKEYWLIFVCTNLTEWTTHVGWIVFVIRFLSLSFASDALDHVFVVITDVFVSCLKHMQKHMRIDSRKTTVSCKRWKGNFQMQAYTCIERKLQFSLSNSLLDSLWITCIPSLSFAPLVILNKTANLWTCSAVFFLFTAISVHVVAKILRSWKSLPLLFVIHMSVTSRYLL